MNIICMELFFLNGAVIDCIEHYLYMKSINVDIQLMFFMKNSKLSPEDIYELIENRYDVDFDFKDGILFENSIHELIHIKGDTIMILDYTTMLKAKNLSCNWNKMIFWYDYNESIMDEYSKLDAIDNCVVLKEMEYEQGTYYKFKFAFSLYKKIPRTNGNVGYINSFSKEDVEKNEEMVKKFDNCLITTHNTDSYSSNNIIAYKHPIDNLFSKFDVYVYNATKYFDPRPRFFHECLFYGKDVIYNGNKQDGSYYRYQDFLSNDLEERTLNEDDYIVRAFKGE